MKHSNIPNAVAGIVTLFDTTRFMPHGHCFQWDPGILWTSVLSDGLIASAYIAIPFTLVFQIMRKRRDLPFDWMFVCFGMFIVACGFTHVMDIITVWRPHYAVASLIKAVTAAASVPTAIILFRIAPRIAKLPSVQQLVDEQKLRVRAEAAVEAKDQFIAVLSHELRTPLTPVKGGLDILEEELRRCDGTTEAVQQAMKMIRHNLEVETVLINDLLDLSAVTRQKLTLQFAPVDLRQIVADAIPLFQEEVRRKQIALQVNTSDEAAIVDGATIRLHQIVCNLLSNAVKFTPEGGEIRVVLGREGERVRLSVSDNGPGIQAEDLERIFRPFEQGNVRAERAQAGLGLGLAIAKTLADAHGGRLRGESNGSGQGATFTLELPGAGEPPKTAEPLVPPPVAGGSKREILLVDDHPDTLLTLALLLRRAGYSVTTAETIAQAEPHLARCEVLVSDIGLPDGSGCDLVLRFRAQGGRAAVAISGYGQEDDFERSRHAGFTEHLVKPLDGDRLIRAIEASAAATG